MMKERKDKPDFEGELTPLLLSDEEFKQQMLNVSYTLAIKYERLNAELKTQCLPGTNIKLLSTITLNIIEE